MGSDLSFHRLSQEENGMKARAGENVWWGPSLARPAVIGAWHNMGHRTLRDGNTSQPVQAGRPESVPEVKSYVVYRSEEDSLEAEHASEPEEGGWVQARGPGQEM